MSLYSFHKKKSWPLRLWHWLTALSIFIILFTVLIKENILSTHRTAEAVVENLKAAGTEISPAQSKALIKSIRKPVWEWHYYAGFALAALAVFRLIVAVFGKQKESNPIRVIFRRVLLPEQIKNSARWYAWVRIAYAFFYINLFIALSTGLFLYFKKDLGLRPEFTSIFKEAHEINMWALIVFIVIHIAGIIAAEQKKATKGIVSGMIGSREEEMKS